MSVWDEKSAAFQWGLETGEKLERERIIKLLKAEAGENWGNIPEWSLNEVIALIERNEDATHR